MNHVHAHREHTGSATGRGTVAANTHSPRKALVPRVGIIAALALCVVTSQTAVSASATTVGSRCVKVGATSWQGKTKLRCTKVGSRLLWKLAAPAKAQPGPQAEPDSTLGTACSDPGHELLNAAGPIRCTGGVRVSITPATDSAASRAYRNLMTQYWANPASTVKLQIVSDTETAYVVAAIERGIRAADRLWSVTVPHQPMPVVIAQNAQSLSTQAATLGLEASATLLELEAQEAAYGGCGQGTFIRSLERPWLLFCMGFAPIDDSLAAQTFGNVGAHEFTHMAQFALMVGAHGEHTCLRMAPWFDEGLAAYTQMSLGSVGGAGGDLRKYWVPSLDSTTATLADYNYTIPIGSRLPYALGLFASEALYALQGTGVADKVLTACGTGLKFSVAFKKATGHTLEAWTPVLSAYVDSVKSRHALTLSQLQALRAKAFSTSG